MEFLKSYLIFLKITVSTFEGKNATVAGWGLTTENGRSACVLRAAQMPVMSNTECFKNTNYRNISNFFIVNNMMCAGYSDGGVDSCQVNLTHVSPRFLLSVDFICKHYIICIIFMKKIDLIDFFSL